MVVGWYPGATCHAAVTHRRSRYFVWEASPATAVLLPGAERSIPVPKGKGGMGQSNAAYAYDASGVPHEGEWIDHVIERISRYTGPNLLRGAAYDELDELTGHGAKRQEEMLSYAIDRGLRAFWRDAEIARAAPGEAHDVVARRAASEERIIVRATESSAAHIDLAASVLDAVMASAVPYALFVVIGISVRVRNGAFVFSGGVPHRESPFKPAAERLVPLVLRYQWARP